MTDLPTRLRQMARAEHDDLSVADDAADEIESLREDAIRYRWLRDGGNDDIGVVSGFGCADSGSSNVVGTYEYILDGEQLDAAIDHARRVEGDSNADS